MQNAVHGCGIAKTQEAYGAAFDELFTGMVQLDSLMSERRYLAGDVATEVDWLMVRALVRFDAVHRTHFCCNGRRLADHPALWAYTRELYQVPGIAETVDMVEIKARYHTTQDDLNPRRIIPGGPLGAHWTAPHGRGDHRSGRR